MTVPPRSIYQVIDRMRERPAMYLGEASLTRLRMYLVGYSAAIQDCELALAVDWQTFHHFNDWVARRYGWYESTAGWCHIILKESKSETAALSEFFRLTDEFRLRRLRVITRVQLCARHKTRDGFQRRRSRDSQPLNAPKSIEICGYELDEDLYPVLHFEIPSDHPTATFEAYEWEDHYANITDAMEQFQKEYGINPDEWVYVSNDAT